jgi:hypothetical protein
VHTLLIHPDLYAAQVPKAICCIAGAIVVGSDAQVVYSKSVDTSSDDTRSLLADAFLSFDLTQSCPLLEFYYNECLNPRKFRELGLRVLNLTISSNWETFAAINSRAFRSSWRTARLTI